MLQSAASVGILLANCIVHVLGEANWRYAFLVGIAPALLTVLVRLGLHEPERWQQVAQTHGQKELGSLPELFSPRFRRHTVVGVLLALSGVFGIWGANYWAPELVKLVAREHRTLILNLQTLGQLMGFLMFAPLGARWGRKPAFAFYYAGSLVFTPLAFHCSHSAVSAACLIPLMGFFTGGMFSGYIVYFPELFPTRLRTTGAGFCYNVARYSAAAFPTFFGTLGAAYGIQRAALMMSSIFIIGLFILPFAPETKDRPLPE